MHESIRALRHLLSTRRLAIAEVIAWSTGIAGELAALHHEGRWHGAITAENIWVAGVSTRLGPPHPAAAGELEDIVQFAVLLREMLQAVDLETESQRAQWNAVDRIAATNLRAAEGCRMKKVAWALKLLRATRPVAAPPRFELPTTDLATEPSPEPTRPQQRFIMLVREITPEPEPNPSRFYAKTLHIWGFVASAAALVGIGCAIVLKVS